MLKCQVDSHRLSFCCWIRHNNGIINITICLAGKPLQADATLLVDATVAAAGGYHMSIAALANANAALNVLQSAYYPTQYLSVAKDTIRKLYNYQQFITAYE